MIKLSKRCPSNEFKFDVSCLMSLPSLFFWKMDSHNSQKVAFKRIFSHSTTYMCRPFCPKWEYFVSLLSRILNASDGEEKVFWLVERILWCARCTSETRTRVPLHSTPLHSYCTPPPPPLAPVALRQRAGGHLHGRGKIPRRTRTCFHSSSGHLSVCRLQTDHL